ncbi:hypothetical protein [Loigolactobacillus zhaoyuanensis]|uniref:SnoaL-like domain-containing protein n=1 Tax=Loigolactobacillus zhaoyuanensis TaxID=2486017 RepID=A0ABW8U9N4_9LACO|nr:hypothetical protein [Loigolactobacillus zhaoyuanensis]
MEAELTLVKTMLTTILTQQDLSRMDEFFHPAFIGVLNGENINRTRYQERLQDLKASAAEVTNLQVRDLFWSEQGAVTAHYLATVTAATAQAQQIDVLALWQFKADKLIFVNEVAWPLAPVAADFTATRTFIHQYII